MIGRRTCRGSSWASVQPQTRTLKCLPWRWCMVHLFPCWRVPVCSGAASTVLPAQAPVCPASSGNETPNLHPDSGLCTFLVHGALSVHQERWGGFTPCVFVPGALQGPGGPQQVFLPQDRRLHRGGFCGPPQTSSRLC